MEINTQNIEGPRVEAGCNIKLDTSLEMELPRGLEDGSDISPRSVISEAVTLDKFGCQHTKLVSHDGHDNCSACGAYVPKNGVRTYKSKKMAFNAFFSPDTIFQALNRKVQQFNQAQNPEYVQIRQNHVDWIIDLAEKLKISPSSMHLAVLLLDTIMFKDPSLNERIQLLSPVCLLIAAKTIELDERIPFIPRLRRYANPTYSVDEYRTAELQVLDLLDWNSQFATALEFTEFFLCQGVLFSNDEVDDGSNTHKSAKKSPGGLRENTGHTNTPKRHNLSSKKNSPEKFASPATKENNENSFSDASTMATAKDTEGTPYNTAAIVLHAIDDETVSPKPKSMLKKQASMFTYSEPLHPNPKLGAASEREIEDIFAQFDSNYFKLLKLILKDSDFVDWDQRVIAGSSIAFMRHMNRITPTWNDELEKITHLKNSQMTACYELICKKFGSIFMVPRAQSNFSAEKTKDLLSELKLINNASLSDKTGYGQSTVHKYNMACNIVINDSADQKAAEKKTIFAPQPRSALIGAVNSQGTYLRDDLRGRTKFPNGTINTEIPKSNLRNPIFPPSYQPSKFQPSQEGLVTAKDLRDTMPGSYLVPADNLLPCTNPSSFACTRPAPALENVQPLQMRVTNSKN